MLKPIAWETGLAEQEGDAGLESFDATSSTNPAAVNPAPFFKPVNIVVENGMHYATIYACKASDNTQAAQRLAMWFSSLKETDCVHLTMASMQLDVCLPMIITLVNAVSGTKATTIIHLDQIVGDALAYFYLLADKVVKGSAGALFVPSYVDQRVEDTSSTWRAIHDLYKWIVDEAVVKGRLTADEASSLHRGSHVVVPDDRF